MATVNYSVIPADTTNLGLEVYSTSDTALISSFQINSRYDLNQHFIEAHVYSLANERLTSVYNYQGEQQLLNSAGAGQEGASTLYIDPVLDAENLGYEQGGVILLYHFLKPIIAPSLYITEISPDRLEIRAAGVEDSAPDLETLQELKSQLQDTSFFSEFRLNFLNNDLFIGVNIDIDTDGSVLFKLYEPLPANIAVKTSFSLVSFVADSVSYEVAATFTPDPVQFNFLKGPNFSIDNREQSSLSTEYLSYNDIYSYPVTGSYHKLLLQASQSGIEVSVDYTDFNNFIHFSSAVERLENFKYKLDLVQYYESKSFSIKNTLSVSASAAVSESSTFYDKQVSGVIGKLDGYEQYLYFESTSFSWPKSNTLSPFLNITSSNATAVTWYNGQIASASLYDELNESSLVYTIPEFIRQDSSNAPYSLFINMVGQHFDNIWLYAKAVTDRYDGDNRLDYGISKDLIGEALKGFGVKLYSSNFSAANLASLLLGEWYDSGSEQITSFVTASNSPTPDKDIIQDTYKRIYHNLPYLIKTKGTERGLRALINCFGIPSGSLEIKSFGGIDRTVLPYFGAVTGSIDKIRLNNTGSIVSGSTLSKYASIQNLDEQYTHDQHVIEAGFSPSYYIDKYIRSNITASFNIDQYIGDPRTAQDSSYTALEPFISSSLGGLDRYDLFDFVRLIKFYDNQVFKMVKDFVPARDNITTGIIIKSHVLERNKIKQPLMSFTQPEFSSSIDTAFFTGSNGGVLADYSTAHSQSFQTIAGPILRISTTEVERFNGELGGSVIDVVTGELNDENPFKEDNPPLVQYDMSGSNGNSPTAGNIFWRSTTLVDGSGNLIGYGVGSMYINEISKNGVDNHVALNSLKVGDKINFTVRADGIEAASPCGTPTNTTVTQTIFAITYKGSGVWYIEFRNNTVVILYYDSTGFCDQGITYLNLGDQTVNLIPYLSFPGFYGSDYNPLLNNAEAIANSAKLRKVDYSNGVLLASNIQALRNNTADFADVQEYLYNSAGMVSSRYVGKQLTGEKVNVFNKETDKSYGSFPVVEQTVPYFGTFTQMSSTADINNAVEISVPYVTFQDGEVYSTGTNPDAGNDVPYIFTRDKIATLSFRTNTSGSRRVLSLNGDYVIKQGGKRVEPIIATQSGSFNAAGKLITAGNDFFNAITFGENTGVDEYRLKGNFSGSTDRATQVANGGTLNIFFATQSFNGTLALWDNVDNAYSLPSPEADTSIKYDTDLYFEFDRDGTGWGSDKISVDVQLEKDNGTIYETLQTKTIEATWNRFGVKYQQPDGIDIVGHYKIDTGIVKVFVKVSMSTGFIPFGKTGSTQKLRLKVINNSTGNDDVYVLDYINGRKLGKKFTVEFRDQSRTADPNGELRVIFGPKFTTLPFNLKSNFRVDQLVKPQAVVSFPANTSIAPFAQSSFHPTSSIGTTISGSTLNPYIYVSSSLTQNFGLFQGSAKHESLGFKEFITPFTIQVGDELRAEGSENKVFTVVDIFEKGDTRINNFHLFANRPDKGMVIVVSPPVPFGTILSNVLVRRYVDDPTKVILFSNDPQTVDEFGTITPQFTSQDLRKNFEKYSNTAFTLIS